MLPVIDVHGTAMNSSVCHTAVFKGLMHRRSVREYTADVPDRDTVQALLEAAVQAPTAMHQEPWGFVVIQDPERLRRYSDAAKALLRDQPGEMGAALHRGEASMLLDPGFDIFYGASTLIIICRVGPAQPFSEADCWLAAENLMLAADAAGLGTCCIGLAIPLLQQPAIKAELGIPPDGTAVAAVLVGVPRSPATATAPSQRQAPKVLSWKH